MRREIRWALCGVGLLMGCARAGTPAESASMDSVASEAPVAESRMHAAAIPAARPGPLGLAAQGAPAAPDAARMIVRNASLALQVSNVRTALETISRMASEAKGFVGTSRVWRDGEHERASLTLRVPSAALDASLVALRGLAVRVDDESLSGEDVTRQAVDLRAQLVNLRATEVELRTLLTTVRQNAKKASDVLEVHTELSRVRGEIEQVDAQLQSLTQLAALSTISVELRPDVGTAPIATDAWQPQGVLRGAVRALVGTLRVGASAAIWAVVYVLPMALLVVVPGLAVWRAVRARRAVKAS